MNFECFNPLDQFEIRDLVSLDVSFLNNIHISLTNIAAYILVASGVTLFVHQYTNNDSNLLSSKWSLSIETIYDTVNNIVVNQINEKKGQEYFPFIYVLFVFILVNNLIGLTPYSFASTSHFIMAFSLSFSIVIGATIMGLRKHGFEFFSFFVPAGCPLALLPLLVIIEFISYIARNISLGLRLAANVLAGHMLLNILSGFTYNIMTSNIFYFFIGLLPLTFIIAFAGLELAIAFIQAQVFVVLSSSYIKDALDLH